MAKSEEILRDAMALPPEARVELTERLVESLAQDVSPEISSAQLAEVRRRIAQVDVRRGRANSWRPSFGPSAQPASATPAIELTHGDVVVESAQRTIENSPAIHRWEQNHQS